LKKREQTVVFMDILATLFEGPRSPSRLAQACNINYGRLEGFTKPLLEKGLIVAESREEQNVFVITEPGYRLYQDWLDVWRRLPLGLTSSQQSFYRRTGPEVKK